MADRSNAWSENVKGRYFVDCTCIACDTCCATAPANFNMHDDGHSVLVKQPENAAEEAACQEAIASCPVDAIGMDKDSAEHPVKKAG